MAGTLLLSVIFSIVGQFILEDSWRIVTYLIAGCLLIGVLLILSSSRKATRLTLMIALVIGGNLSLKAQHMVTVKEVSKPMPTYNFSDSDPVANVGKIYPYFRFSGYSAQPEEKKWKFIELENDYIKVFITPEIGGKIWGAIEKSTGKEFIYYNHSVKFRDVAMRGPWTSGGIESNFGAIGHAPTCSTPVDYFIRKNKDGSISCFIGAIDLASRTTWRVEINLQADKSYFTTRAMWHNPTPWRKSYYQWMNAAVKTAGNLEYSYPGTNYIGHDGSLHSWPLHPDGMDLSWYENNNFGGYKSYHIIGELTNFFGGYWHDDEFGFGHYANYSAKPGKKLWIWGLSRQGMIWENLLTDSDGQYTEIQSGRLFNQEAHESMFSPFKHRSFAPYATDEWTEYWFPVMAIKGVTQASPKASVHLEVGNGNLDIRLSSNTRLNDSLQIIAEDEVVGRFKLNLKPTEVIHHILPFNGAAEDVSVKLGADYIIRPGGTAKQKLNRPMQMVDFDWTTVQGKAIQAKSLEQERDFNGALAAYLECLSQDPNYLPALVGAAGLYWRQTNDQEALVLLRRALAIDAYYPSANFLYGVIHEKLDHEADAIDGYSVAAATPSYKSAAYLGLARISFRGGELTRAIDYAKKSLVFNANNFSARELLLVALRKSSQSSEFQQVLTKILDKDPLNHFARFERYMMGHNRQDLTRFKDLIRNELHVETYLELAMEYYYLGLNSEAKIVLKASPKNPIALYWLAYLNNDEHPEKAKAYLAEANGLTPTLVFPFREESIPVLSWAVNQTKSWKASYYLGLIWWNLGEIAKAKEQFLTNSEHPDFGPYYLAKAKLFNDNDDIVLQSLETAATLSPNDWRTALALSVAYRKRNDLIKAISTLKSIFKKKPTNYYIGLNYARALMLTNQNDQCLQLLQQLTVLPNEGATEGHHLYRISSLNLAVESLSDKAYDETFLYLNFARAWPENLGVGKPYVTDERIENYIEALAFSKTGQKQRANKLWQSIAGSDLVNENRSITAEGLIKLATYIQLDQIPLAKELIKSWQKSFPEDPFVRWSGQWLAAGAKEAVLLAKTSDRTTMNQKIDSPEYYLRWVVDFLNNNPINK